MLVNQIVINKYVIVSELNKRIVANGRKFKIDVLHVNKQNLLITKHHRRLFVLISCQF